MVIKISKMFGQWGFKVNVRVFFLGGHAHMICGIAGAKVLTSKESFEVNGRVSSWRIGTTTNMDFDR